MIADDTILSAHAKLVAFVLLRWMGRGTNAAFPSIDTLAERTGLARGTVLKALAELEASRGPGRIEVVRRCRQDGPGRAPNVYRMHLDQSARAEPKSSEQSPPLELSSADLSPSENRPEFKKGGDLSPPCGRDPSLGTVKENRGSRARQTTLFEVPQTEHARVIGAYFECFEKARGRKPPFRAREGSAIKKLITDLGSADKAIELIQGVYADPQSFSARTASLLTIAADPARYVGGGGGKTSVPRQPAAGSTWQTGEEYP